MWRQKNQESGHQARILATVPKVELRLFAEYQITGRDPHRIRARPSSQDLEEKFLPSAPFAAKPFHNSSKDSRSEIFGTIEDPLKISSGPGCQTWTPVT
jgi:hypothetical protein